MGEFLQKRYIVRSKIIIDRSPVPVRDADNCAIRRYQPVPVSYLTALVERCMLRYALVGFGCSFMRKTKEVEVGPQLLFGY